MSEPCFPFVSVVSVFEFFVNALRSEATIGPA